ncbi:MAG: putative RND superfamily exporter protein [Hyphomicrobiaceae bacterium]|jgi:predicted RND superfamily exporter protein
MPSMPAGHAARPPRPARPGRRRPPVARDRFDRWLRTFAAALLRKRASVAVSAVAVVAVSSGAYVIMRPDASAWVAGSSSAHGASAFVFAPLTLAVGLRSPLAMAAPLTATMAAVAAIAAVATLLPWLAQIPAPSEALLAITIALILACSASSHLLAIFQHGMQRVGNRRRAVADAVELAGRPVLTSAVAAAAIVLAASALEPNTLTTASVLTAACVSATILLTLAVLPAWLSYGPDLPRPTRDEREQFLARDRRRNQFAKGIQNWRKQLAVVLTIGLCALIGGLAAIDRSYFPAAQFSVAATAAMLGVTMFLFGNRRAAALATLPVAVSLLTYLTTAANIGVVPSGLGLLSIPLVAAVAGDGAIHYLTHFRRAYVTTGRAAAANRHCFRLAAPTVTINAAALAAASLGLAWTATPQVAMVAGSAVAVGWLMSIVALPILLPRLSPFQDEHLKWMASQQAPKHQGEKRQPRTQST